MADPRVSVIMPAYNAAATIGSALESLASQTCRDLEVVVVDDGSSDATASIVERIAASSAVPVRLVSQPNAGRATARNRGINSARGEFLGFVDADDTAEPQMFERLLTCVEATGADLVICEYLGVDSRTGAVLYDYREGDSSYYGGRVVERAGLLSHIAGSVCNKLFHRSLFDATGIEFPPGRDFEDLATVYRLMGEAHRIEKVAEPLYRYRHGQPSSIMSANDTRYLQILDALAVTNDHFARKGDFDALRDDLETVNFTHLILGRYDDLFRFGSRGLRHAFIVKSFAHMDSYFLGWRHDAAIRKASGRTARFAISTNRNLLRLYTDLTAKGKR